MDTLERFFSTIRSAPTIMLATAADDSVTMRVVSPVYYAGAILIFTGSNSTKYRQLRINPHCCIAAGDFFAEATAEFHGATMLPENHALRVAYTEKFPDAFDETVAFGGRNAEFLLLHPTRLSGWAFASDMPAEGEIPSIPFSVTIP